MVFEPTVLTDADGRQLEFSLWLSRRRNLHNKIPFFFSDYPTVHTRNLATNKPHAEGPATVLGGNLVEDGEGDGRQHRPDGGEADADC